MVASRGGAALGHVPAQLLTSCAAPGESLKLSDLSIFSYKKGIIVKPPLQVCEDHICAWR